MFSSIVLNVTDCLLKEDSIDLSFIPQELKQRIINTYEEIKPAPKNKMLDYFISHKLKNLIDVIEEF
jgi:hypothetical protein